MAYGPAQAFPPQPPVPEGFGAFGGFGAGAAGVNPAWLASSADRERAVGVLRAGFTEGRLTQDELDDRVARAYAARTYGQLWELTSDLPVGALPYPQFPHGQAVMVTPEAAPPSHWKPAAALIITALIIFTLAALITAVITAHTQGVIYQTPGFQHANLTPFIQPIDVPPKVIHVFPVISPGR
ncbi:MAG TPA: DUF1707 domain-containing protein [Streptosporangiaceae bacterium]|nr:DUF1707 domain-containing protein [Streptosporangiaceae bacterium]